MKEFHAKHKHHIRLWILLAAITLASGIIAYGDLSRLGGDDTGGKTPNAPDAQEQNSSVSTIPERANAETSTPQPEPDLKSEQKIADAPSAVETIDVVLEIGGKQYPLHIVPGGSVYDLIVKAKAQQLIMFSARNYGGDLGQLVEEINGIKNSVREKKYWIYYINGKKAQIGISNYHPKAHDIISWNYEDETL